MFEIISVILFVIVLRLLPKENSRQRTLGNKAWRIPIAVVRVGLLFGWMTLIAASHNRNGAAQTTNPGARPELGHTLAQHSYGLKTDDYGNAKLDTAMGEGPGDVGNTRRRRDQHRQRHPRRLPRL